MLTTRQEALAVLAVDHTTSNMTDECHQNNLCEFAICGL